jgi:hypothetical protein
MDLHNYLGKTIIVTFDDGLTVTGLADGFSMAQDNEEFGEDELILRTDVYPAVVVRPSEIASIQVLEPAQSKKRFPLVAASL